MATRQKSIDYRLLLRQAGFRATPGRVAVLTILGQSPVPLSIKDIQSKLRQYGLDPATLYRMMNALERAGLLRLVDFKHGHAHYELQTKAHHHHLICESCGKVVDISIRDTNQLERKALQTGKFAKITSHALELFGICSTCARSAGKRS